MRVKVCGITREEDLAAAARAGADAVGLISEVSVDTPREVSPDRAAELAASAPPFVATVLVTMAPTTGRVIELAERVQPDAVQVHADFSPQRLMRIVTALEADVVKTVDADRPAQVRRYDGVADAVLVDSVDAEGGGGTGRTHDWERTREVVADVDVPALLAGGLTPGNVGEAVETVDPYGVDVATGVEREGGMKDHDAVEAFVANAYAADPRLGVDGEDGSAVPTDAGGEDAREVEQ